MDNKNKKNIVLKRLGTTMLASSIALGGFTAVDLQVPTAVVHADPAEVIVEKGDEDKYVIQLKKELAIAGFPVPGDGTDYFGEQTEKQVKAFQKYYGLDETGKVNNATDQKLANEVRNNLQQPGKGDKNTIDYKKWLAEAGFPVSKNPTKVYGATTAAQVKAFQKKVGLHENGIIDSYTFKELEVYKPTQVETDLSQGVRAEEVKDLKEKLKKAGFTVPGSGTNYFGPQTTTQVENFQVFAGLEVTGSVNEKTEKALNDLVNSSLQRGKRNSDVVELKKMLAKVGFTVPGSGNNFFGAQTEKQVKAFQKSEGLVQNGIADKGLRENGTWETLKTKADSITDEVELKVGVSHKDVVTLKESLEKAGFPVSKKKTQYFGPKTQQQLDAFAANYPKLAGSDAIDAVNNFAKNGLQNGSNSAAVVDLKDLLKAHGFEAGSGTYYFGPKTERALKDFQNKFDLIPNGVVLSGNTNDPTWAALNNPDNLPSEQIEGIKVGDTDSRVSGIKANLKEAGFGVTGSVGNNYYGKQTEKQVQAFQEAYNDGILKDSKGEDFKVDGIDELNEEGIADKNTIKALEEFVKAKTPSKPETPPKE